MLKHILVVEDDELLCSWYAADLRSRQVDVSCALSLAQARQLLEQQRPFDAVVLDNHLEDGDGLWLVPLIRKQFSYCTVIMVSADMAPETFLTAFDKGIDDYLLKPVNLDLLWLKLNKNQHSYQLQQLSEQQQQHLAARVSQEQREQQLARHVFDALIGRLPAQQDYLQQFGSSTATFCGDLVLHQIGLDGSFYLLLADSMGHGLAAAIALLPVIEVFQTMSRKGLSLSHLVFELNEKLRRQLPDDRFVAAVLLRVSVQQQQIEIWNGGMPALLLLDAAGVLVAEARSRHMALGILSDQQLDLSYQTVALGAVQRIVGYTDGLTDNLCVDGRQLNADSILAMCQQSTDLMAFAHCLAARSPQMDDMTLFSLQLPMLERHLRQTADEAGRDGVLTLSLQMAGQMLAHSDVSNQLVRLLQLCDMPQSLCNKTFSVLTELFLNAFEHGVLGLSSALKQQDNGFLQYYEEKQRRISALTDQQFVRIRLQWQAALQQVELEVLDSGAGFAKGQAAAQATAQTAVLATEQTTAQSQQQASGRGMTLVRSLCQQVEYLGKGNEVRVLINR